MLLWAHAGAKVLVQKVQYLYIHWAPRRWDKRDMPSGTATRKYVKERVRASTEFRFVCGLAARFILKVLYLCVNACVLAAAVQ